MSAREVTLVGGSPWGFRMHGGHDLYQPLRISRVNPGSKAAQQGVREGDLISSINDRNTRDLTNGEAHALLRNAGDQLKLGLNQETVGSPKRRIYKSSLQENTSIETLKRTTKTTTTSSTRLVSTDAKKTNGTDDTQTERGTFASQNGALKNSPSATESSNAEPKTKRSKNRPIEQTSGYITEDCADRWQRLRMPRSSRGRKNRRNRNNKRANNSRQSCERHEKSAFTGDNGQGDNSDEESVANDGKVVSNNDSIVVAEVREGKLDTDDPITREPVKSSDDLSTTVNGENAHITSAKGSSTVDLVETRVNGHAIKVTTEELPRHFDGKAIAACSVAEKFPARREIESMRNKRRPPLVPGSAMTALKRRLRIERKAVNTEPKIVEITSVSGNSPLAASISHVTGVGIIEAGMTGKDDVEGTIVTISEPLERVQPLPNALASKVEGLMLGKGELDELTLLARAAIDNKNNDERDDDDDENERSSNGPEIREVSDSDAETDNSSSSRPTTGAPYVIETESDIDRDSVFDHKCDSTIAEETEDENLAESDNFAELEEIEIPEDLSGAGMLNRDGGTARSETVENLTVSEGDGNPRDIEIAREIHTPLRENAEGSENTSEEEKNVSDSSAGLKEISKEFLDPVEPNCQGDESKSEIEKEMLRTGDAHRLGDIPRQFCDQGEPDRKITGGENVELQHPNFEKNLKHVEAPENVCTRPVEPLETPNELLANTVEGTTGEAKKNNEYRKEYGGKNSLIKDQSLEGKVDKVSQSGEKNISTNEKCSKVINSSSLIQQNEQDMKERSEGTKLNNDKTILEGTLLEKTGDSKKSDESTVSTLAIVDKTSSDSTESSVTKEVENKLRIFIEGLELPTFIDELYADNHRVFEIDGETSGNSSQRRAKKRAILDSYYAEAKHADRFLDIIQEEGEKLSEGDERHIRDFINEEISKFRRKKRDVDNRPELRSMGEETRGKYSKSTEVHVIYPNSDKHLSHRDSDTDKSLNNSERTKTMMRTVSETEKSTKETQVKFTEIVTNKQNVVISERIENKSSTEQLEKVSSSNIDNSHNRIYNGSSNENEYSNHSRESEPPIPPKRFSSYASEEEIVQPPTPPDIDYPDDVPEIPTLPAEFSTILQHPPVPPRKKNKVQQSIDEIPKRPPLPMILLESKDLLMGERIYENMEHIRGFINQVPPPLPPLPRNIQGIENGTATVRGLSKIPPLCNNFPHPLSDYCRRNAQCDDLNGNEQVISSPEVFRQDRRRDDPQLRNPRPIDGANNDGYTAGNDAHFEIVSSVGNRCVYNANGATMRLAAPLSSRKITAPNFGHSDLTRQQAELSGEFSQTGEQCASGADLIRRNIEKRGRAGSDEVKAGNRRENIENFCAPSDVTSRNSRVINDKVEANNTLEGGKSGSRCNERIVPVEKSWEKSDSRNEAFSKKSNFGKSECCLNDLRGKVSSIGEQRTDEKGGNSFVEFEETNSKETFIEDIECSTFSTVRADSHKCVENNQTERPTRPPRRQQQPCFFSSAPSSSRLLGTETCFSQGQANLVTTAEDKNSGDNDSRTLPTLVVTKTAEEITNSIPRTPSPERNEVVDDQESSSSGAATPNTVRLNSSNSFIDLVALEDRGEFENFHRETQSLETKLINPVVSNYVKTITDKSQPPQEGQDLYYVPLRYQSCPPSETEPGRNKDARPNLLKDLCIRKILSLPYGLHIINEITLPQFNIFKSIQALQESVNRAIDHQWKASGSDRVDANTDFHMTSETEMKKQRPKTWTGVPTMEDPKLLVCLSPSQQEYQVRTSVDNLLDLHKKFLNRQSYHEDHRDVIDVPKYWVELGTEMRANGGTEQSLRDPENRCQDVKLSGPGNRLLEIIKENPIENSKQNSCMAAGKCENGQDDDKHHYGSNEMVDLRDIRQDRLRATRLSDWLNLARRDPRDYSLNRENAENPWAGKREGIENESDRCSKTSSMAIRGSSIQTGSDGSNACDTPSTRDNLVNNTTSSSPENKRSQGRSLLMNDVTARTAVDNSYEKIYDQVISEMEHNSQQMGRRYGEAIAREHRFNASLLTKSMPSLLTEQQTSTTPIYQYEKSPISFKSAIIDKSSSVNDESSSKQTPPLKWTRSIIDPRHNVNPALIDAKSGRRDYNETVKCNRPSVVDRSCIDTTSIFDKTPPSCRLASRKYQDPEALKQDTAANIMKNLKRLQSNTNQQHGGNIDGRRRFSLPQEYLDRQLQYIEQLENQLREVILAEEDERKVYEEFRSQADCETNQRIRDMNDLSNGTEMFRHDGLVEKKPDAVPENSEENVGKVKGTLDNDVPGNERESWHEESMTREGYRSEFSKKEGHREATKSVTAQGDLHVEKSTTSYEIVEEKRMNSAGEELNGSSSETDLEWKTLFGDDVAKKSCPGGRNIAETCKSFDTNTAGTRKTTKTSGVLPPNGEVFRRRMFDEYVHKVHEREERKQHKVIKISSHADNRENSSSNTGMSKMEREFIDRARNRMSRFGIKLDDSSESEVPIDNDNDFENESSTKHVRSRTMSEQRNGNCQTAKCLIDGREIKDPKSLPKHLQEFLELATTNDPAKDESVMFAPTFKASSVKPGVWSPGSEPPPPPQQPSLERGKITDKDAGIPPVWTPSSAGASPVAERKEFRPVAFESPVLSRKKFTSQTPTVEPPPPWKDEDIKRDSSQAATHNITTRIVNSHSAPSQGLNSLAGTPRLPRAQNPTITLLQKAREGQLPKGAAYLEDGESSISEIKSYESPHVEPIEIIHTIKREYDSEPETTETRRKKMTNRGPRKIEGIGPTTKDGMPVALRSEVKDSNQAKWYKKMYDSLHRADKDDDYVTVRYKPRRGGRYGYGSSSGYLSEPEQRMCSERSATLDTRRRQRNKENDFSTSTMPRKAAPLTIHPEVYRTQPGRIENYEPGRSSIADKETKEWWDEVMDIFDGWLEDNRHVSSDQRTNNNGINHQTSRVLSLSYRPDSSDSVSFLSPLTSSRLAKTPESNSSKIVQRLMNVERSTNHTSAARVQKLANNRPSATTLSIVKSSAPEVSCTNSVPASLIIDHSTESSITSAVEHSCCTFTKSPNKSDRRLNSIIHSERNSRRDTIDANGGSIKDRENGGKISDRFEDRIIRPLADTEHFPRYSAMPEAKSKSFILPDRDSSLAQRMLAPLTGSQSNLTGIGTDIKERTSLVTGPITRKDFQQYSDRHRHNPPHRHHHHNHLHHHQRRPRFSTSNTTTASSTSSSSPCTFSTIRNVTLPPSSMPTIANNITAKNPLSAASSRPFDQRSQHTAKPYMSHALKESGYESDSTLIFRRRDDASPLSPLEQRLAYKTIQKGGDVPLHGLRKPAPERLKDDTEIEYFPISPTLTRIRVRRRNTAAFTKDGGSSMSSSASSMTFARYKRTAPSAPTNITIFPSIRIATAKNGTRSVVGRTSSTISTTRTTVTTTRTTSQPPGRPPTRVASPKPPSPPRRRSSRHNATLKTHFVKNRTIERSSSCPDSSRVPPANRRHDQCFAAESASNIRFLRERLSNKLSSQLREREITGKSLGNVQPPSTSPSLGPKKKSTASSKPCQPELPKLRSEPCPTKKNRDCSISPARQNIYSSAKIAPSCRQVSRSASPIWRSSQEQPARSKKICHQGGLSGEKAPLARSNLKSTSFVGSSNTSLSGLGTTARTSRLNGRSKLLSDSTLNTDKTQASRTRTETIGSLKRIYSSYAELTSPTEVKKGLPKRDFQPRLTPSNSSAADKVTTNLGGSRQKTVEGKTTKNISENPSKSRASPRLSSKDASSSKRNLASPTSSTAHRTSCKTPPSTLANRTKTKKSTTSDVRSSSGGSSSIAVSDHNLRKRPREKAQTIVKKPPEILITPEAELQEKKHTTAKRCSVSRENHREPSRSKRVTSDNGSEKKKNKKPSTPKSSTSRDKESKKIMKKEPTTAALSMERLKQHQQATRTDTFFQNLFLRNLSSPVPSQSSIVRRSSVMERARIFQECSAGHFKSEPSLRGLSVYLANKRPVSNSRFKNWERESLSSRSSSPYGVSWPGRSVFSKVSKFCSLLGMNEFGSSSSLRGRSPISMTDECPKERSLSEPPLKINSSQCMKEVGRVASPITRTPSPSPTRSAACRRIKSLKQQDRPEIYPPKMRARSVSEAEDSERKISNFGSNLSLAKSTGSLESPPLNRDDYQRYLLETFYARRKSERYRDLHDFYASLERMGELERTTSANDLRPRLKDEEIIDYDRWKEIRSKERAEQELREIYGRLKNVQRNKDFLFSTRDVDKYKWRGDSGLRCKERSVENIKESFRRLENEESELESTRRREIASKKDVYKPLWRGSSVANVANDIARKTASRDDESDRSPSFQPELQKHFGGSKKFWSSLSIEQVMTLKNQLNEIYGSDINGKTKNCHGVEVSEIEKNQSPRDELGKIHQQRENLKPWIKKNSYEVVIPPREEFGDSTENVGGLHVRCHSMLTSLNATGNGEKRSENPSSDRTPNFKRRGSIGNGRNLGILKPESVVPTPPPLSEMEKKRLSLTLGKEILDKVTRKRASTTAVIPRETRGAIASVSMSKPNSASSSVTPSITNTSPRTCYSFETSFDEDSCPQAQEKSDFLLVLTPSDDTSAHKSRVETVLDEWSRKPPLLAMSIPGETSTKAAITSGSEFDSTTESSETSVRTVVRRGSEAEVVPKKVEFYEKIERAGQCMSDKPLHERSEKLSSCRHLAKLDTNSMEKKSPSKMSSAQSFADLKELFGESQSARYTTLPFRSIGRTLSTSPDSEHRTDGSGSGRGGRSISVSPDVTQERAGPAWQSLSSGFQDRDMERARSVSPCPISDSTCSLESCRNRSVSPDPERYWRAYLNLVKNGSVKKLRAKFESLEELTGDRTKFVPTPKRFQSDPELTRNLLKRVSDERKTHRKLQESTDVAWLRRKYEPTTRGRSRRRVAKSPPIPRIPLRLEDLSMPRINVISKTAELKDNAVRTGSTDSLARKAETEELEAKKPVGKIREKFEKFDGKSSNAGKPSLLGEMFTSAPNVHELRDIAPYLAGRWVAHKYPNRRDNARSLSLPPDLENPGLDPPKKIDIVKPRTGRSNVSAKNGERKRTREVRGSSSSSSPVRPRTPNSILKQSQVDPFANQTFDPSIHRPRYRYQPPPPPPPPPLPIYRRETRTWWPPIPTYTAKPSVTFEEYANAPPPPPKAQHNRSERPESPRRYVEGEVTIHYRSPVRHEAKEILSEEELARRSAENMRRVYQEERRRKYLQELHDIDSRRHTDNFVPSQKSPIPLNRYDDFVDDLSYRSRSQEQTPEPRLVARALYNFVGQSSRELTFRRGDLIFVRRQVDKNWYEGEHNAMIGLFPFNYVEILPYDGARTTPKKPYEGQARAKFNFVAQTNLELSLAKGEFVVITRRVDENWYEGRIGNRKGIFPVSYVEVISEPGHISETPMQSSKPVASPAAHSLLSNGTAGGKMSMGPHHYTPSMPVNTSTTQPHYNSLPRVGGNKLHVAPVNETLHIDTHSETIPYRALYNYRPQNEDELELKEGDTVYVMEKCDDGWYVGSSQRTGYFGTFPGNYVERL